MVRKAETEDYKEICDILTNDLGYSTDEEMVRINLNRINDDREAVFVAVSEGIVCGVIHVEKYQSLYFRDIANIMCLAVKNEFHRKGHGRELMERAEKWAVENGLCGIRLESGAQRENAHKFYRAMGFGYENNRKKFRKMFNIEVDNGC